MGEHRTRVVVTDYIHENQDWEAGEMRKRGVDFQCHQLKLACQAEVIEKVKDADVIIVNMVKFPASVVNALQRCRLIIRHGIGYDNVDADAAAGRGIRLCNVPDYCAREVAEQTIMHVLTSARHFLAQREALHTSVEKGQWDFSMVPTFYLLEAKTLGIIGCGRIGSVVLQLGRGLGMNCIVCDPYLSRERKQELRIETLDMHTVLREADVVTLHTPLSDETRGFIGEEELTMMKPTAHLINTARGPLIDTAALAKALESGGIAGAGIDVYETEPPRPDYVLLDCPAATLTPHLAWYSYESGWTIRKKILEDVDRYLKGEPPRFTVNPSVEKVLGGKAYRELVETR